MINQYKKIVGIITLCAYLCLPKTAFSQQCPTTATSGTTSFTMNGKVTTTGDGNGIGSADNNKVLTICLNQKVLLENNTPGAINVGYRFYDNIPSNFPTAPGKPANPAGQLDYLFDIGEISNTTKFSTDGSITGILVMTGSAASNGATACQLVKIIKPQAPKVTFPIPCAGGAISIDFKADPANVFDSYLIKYTGTASAFTDSEEFQIPNAPPFVFSGKTLPAVPIAVTVTGINRIDNTTPPLYNSSCPTTSSTPNTITPNANILKRVNPIALEGTEKNGEYVIRTPSENAIGTKINVYQREESGSYDFTKPPLKDFNTNFNKSLSIDSVKFTVNGAANKNYCFKTETVDNCPSGTPQQYLSQYEICTTLINVVAEDNVNKISWSKFFASSGLSFNEYDVEYYDSLSNNWKPLGGGVITDVNNIGPFEHRDIECGKKYAYRVTTDAGPPSSSQIKIVTAISADIPKAASVIFASLNDKADSVRIQCAWKNAAETPKSIMPNSYRVWRADSPTGAFSVVNTGNSFFKDGTFNVNEESKCYYMDYSNLCGTYSDKSKIVCSILAKTVGERLSWTAQTPVGEGVEEYRIQLVDGTTGLPINPNTPFFPRQTTKTFLDADIPDDENQTLYVRVEAFPVGYNVTGGRNAAAQSNIIKIFRPTNASFAQVFTPNGDGFNDKFGAYVKRYKFVVKAQMMVYDRWGNIIYSDETTDRNELDPNNLTPGFGWDGKMKDGTYANEGTYAFRMVVEDQSGQKTSKDGVVLVAYKQP